MMAQSSDVVIVGGGVIGLSIAYALVREGIRPTVLDRRELGREASWAGAGLIPPIAERAAANPNPNPAVALRSWSARLYPDWSAALREETGIDTGYRRTGGVDVAWTEPRRPGAAGRGRPVAGRGDRLRAAAARRLSHGSSRRSTPSSEPSTTCPTAPRSATPGCSAP